MKKYFLFVIATIFAAVACSQYDDTEITDRVDNLENRVAALEKLQSQVSELQTLVQALQNKDYVTGVTPIMEGGVQVGYYIMFTQSGTVEIRNGVDGTNGSDGKDGAAGAAGANGKDGSVVSIKQDTDGIYYWTIDGQFTDPKLRVDGVTPQFKIDDDSYICVSYDGGATWTQLGKTGATVSANYKVTYDEDYVYITFKDEDDYKVTIPRQKEFALSFAVSAGVGISAGKTVELPFVLTNADETVVVETLCEGGYKAEVSMTDVSNGVVKVTAPDPLVDGKVLVFANKGDKTCMKALYFEAGVFTLQTNAVEAAVGGGEICAKFTTNQEYTISIESSAASWLSALSTKAAVADSVFFMVEANYGEARSAKVTFKNGESELGVLTVSQAAYAAATSIKALFGFNPTTADAHGMTKDANFTMAVIGNYLILSNTKDVSAMPVYNRMTGEYLPHVKVNVTGIDTSREIMAIANDDAGHLLAVAYTTTKDSDTSNDTVRGWVWKNGIDKAPTSFMWAALDGSRYANKPVGINGTTALELYRTVRVYGDLTKNAVIATCSPQTYRPVFEFVTDGKLGGVFVEFPSGAKASLFNSSTVVPMNYPSDATSPADLEYFWCSANYAQNMMYTKSSKATVMTAPKSHWWNGSGTYDHGAWGIDAIRINGTTLFAAQNCNYAGKVSTAGVNQFWTRLYVAKVGDTPTATSLTDGFLFDSREGDSTGTSGVEGSGYKVTGMTAQISMSGGTLIGDNDTQTGCVKLAAGDDGQSVQVYLLSQNQGLFAYTIPFSKF